MKNLPIMNAAELPVAETAFKRSSEPRVAPKSGPGRLELLNFYRILYTVQPSNPRS